MAAASKDLAVIAKIAKSDADKGLRDQRRLQAERAKARIAARELTPAEKVRQMGVADVVQPAAQKLAAQHKLEYIMQSETSRAVLQRVEQQMSVTQQLE